MKKLLLVFFLLPMFGHGQDFRPITSCDLMINQLLENTIGFLRNKNAPKLNFKSSLETNESSINWNEDRLLKWQIPERRLGLIQSSATSTLIEF